MSKPFVSTARIEGGQIKLRNRPGLEKWASLERDGEYTATFERQHATRNLEQNALYWVGYIKPLSEHTGYTSSEMHAYLKARFLPAAKRQVKILLLHDTNGVVIDEYELDLSTTTTLNRLEFGDYLRDIEVFAATLGVEVGTNREAA